jgi:adenylate cyclase
MRFPRLFGGGAGATLRLVERLWALGILILALAVRTWDPAPVEILRYKQFDVFQILKPAKTPPFRVTIVEIDEESLAKIGQWPWPRTVIADLILKLRAAGAVVIGFDVIFPEPDRTSPALFLKTLRGLDPELVKVLKRLPDNDAVMATAMRQALVVLGQSGFEREGVRRATPPKKAPYGERGENPRPYLLHFPGLIRNIPALEKAARGVGMITVKPEQDGVTRRVPLVSRVGEDIFPALAVEMLRVATGGRAYATDTGPTGVSGVILRSVRGQVKVPTDRDGHFWIHFRKSERSRYVSAKDVLAKKAPAALLRGKLVLVGASAVGLRDIKATPLEAAIPGVEAQAFVIENIISKTFLTRPVWTTGAEYVATVLFSLLLIVVVPMLGAIRALLLGFVGVASSAGGVWYAFTQKGLLLDLTFPLSATFAVYAVLAYMNYVGEERSKRQVRSAFSRYMSPALVEQLAEQPERLVLGGETKELSILFSDIRGFTTISEGLDAAELTGLINDYLTPMTEVLLANSGTIDKYIGDAIMAFWNAPLNDQQHAKHSCRAALGMLAALKTFNEEGAALAASGGRPHIPIRIGIGINTGLCSVGNMGSMQRFDYSVLGDAVNLAARLESATKDYGVEIIIGENTQALVPNLATMELDLVKVKGKTEASRIFGLFGDEGYAASPEFAKLKACNHDMLTAARDEKWTALDGLIAECRTLAGGRLDGYYDIFQKRGKSPAA